MTSGRQGRTPGHEHVGPVDGTTRLRRSGSSMDLGAFTDRVMVRIAQEPTPSPSRVFFRSLRRLAIRDAVHALAAAWRLAFEPASPVAASARASAAALFLSVIVVVGVGGAFVTGGVLTLLGPDGRAPQEVVPAAAPSEVPAATILPTPSPSPSPPPVTEQAPSDLGDRTELETLEPGVRQQEKKEKRETPEPKERERDERDEKDERDERDEEDERDDDD